MSIAERLGLVRTAVGNAARAAGRAPEEVTLVAVSKKHSADAIREAYAAGQRDFGESYAQELVRKREELSDLTDIRWHFIGALQSNKARQVVPGVTLIHAVDRESVLDALSRRAASSGAEANVLVEVNVGGEASKAGVAMEAVEPLLQRLGRLPAIACRGLMCIPPPVAPGESNRAHFAALRDLRDRLRPRHPTLELLSMGMSDDFPEAIAEGATHIRVGTAIFGQREPAPTPSEEAPG